MAEQLLSSDPQAGVLLSADPRAGRTTPPATAIQFDGRGLPRVSSDDSDAPPSDLLQMLGPLAHPETFTDFARLLTLPVDTVRKAAASALAMAVARPGASAALTKTGQVVERAGHALDNGTTKTIGAYELIRDPKSGGLVLAAPPILKGVGRVLQKAGAAIAPSAAAAVSETTPIAAEVSVAAPVAAGPAAVPAPAAAASAATPSLKLTADEWKEFQRLIGRGVKTPEALKTVQAMRELAARLGGATPSEVAKAVAQRETTGRW